MHSNTIKQDNPWQHQHPTQGRSHMPHAIVSTLRQKKSKNQQEQFWICIFVIPWKVKKQEQRNRKFPSKSLLCGNMRCSTGGSRRSCIPTLWNEIIVDNFSIPHKVGITRHTQKSAHYAESIKLLFHGPYCLRQGRSKFGSSISSCHSMN